MIKHLLVVAGNFPSPGSPSSGTFVQEFVRGVARQGVKCTVIAPVALHKGRNQSAYPIEAFDDSAGSGQRICILRPRFISLSAWNKLKLLGKFNPTRFTYLQFESSVLKTIQKRQLNPDAIYGHFLYFSGATAVRLGKRLGIPAFPCVGEGELWTIDWFGKRVAQTDLANATGFMTVNSGLAGLMRNDLGFDKNPIGVFPNGADLQKFYPRDKWESREALGLPHDQFLVASIGNFLFKKGVVRVGEAIDGLPGVSGIFAGSGPLPPQAKNIALCRRVQHSDIPILLSACDVFVLPTMVEGSCNALVEAMACGLPIISSDSAFNDDLLDEKMSIRVDPLDVVAIRKAIIELRDNSELRNKMSLNSIEKAKQFDVNDRVIRMLEFMSSSAQ